jgi:hypothetical protein
MAKKVILNDVTEAARQFFLNRQTFKEKDLESITASISFEYDKKTDHYSMCIHGICGILMAPDGKLELRTMEFKIRNDEREGRQGEWYLQSWGNED